MARGQYEEVVLVRFFAELVVWSKGGTARLLSPINKIIMKIIMTMMMMMTIMTIMMMMKKSLER